MIFPCSFLAGPNTIKILQDSSPSRSILARHRRAGVAFGSPLLVLRGESANLHHGVTSDPWFSRSRHGLHMPIHPPLLCRGSAACSVRDRVPQTTPPAP